jgi:transcriptional regulator with GAF, ATPase, and Fis domain
VAPLRYRKGDIPLLAEHFLGLLQKRENRKLPRLSAANLKKLQGYDWPGNVRELQNVIERAVITSHQGRLHFTLPDDEDFGDSTAASAYDSEIDDGKEIVPESEMRRRERQNIIAALKMSNWKIYGTGGAAELLGIKPTTLTSRIKKMNVKKPGA